MPGPAADAPSHYSDVIADLVESTSSLRDATPEVWAGFGQLHKAAVADGALSAKVVASEFPWAVFPVLGMSLGVWFHWNFGVRHGEQFMQRHQEDVEREVQRHRAAA